MAEPFLGEIRAFSFDFAPRGWAECNGQLLPINQNQALFSLLGTQFGGNGQTNFALPDLRGRSPLGQGVGPTTTYATGDRAGVEFQTLSPNELAPHTHRLAASTAAATQNDPTAGVYATPSAHPRMATLYAGAPNASGGSNGTTQTGGGQPHDNRQPHLTVLFAIALQGIFPPRN